MKPHARHDRSGQTSFWDRLDLMIQSGGLVQRNLLQNIPNVDLEVYGCQKYDSCGNLRFAICYPVVIFI